MIMFSYWRLPAFALALTALFAFVAVADAGWVTFKNETGKAIVVQEYIVINGKKVCGKPYKLRAGESFREFQNTPGVRNYDVLDAANPNSPLWSKSLDCRGDKQIFSVTAVKGKVDVQPAGEEKKP